MGYKKMKGFDWGTKYKDPTTMDYHPSNKEFAGMQYGNTNDYIERRDAIQNKAASKIRDQSYKGRYQ